MRIADFDEDIKYGKVEALDDEEMERLEASIREIVQVNKDMWEFFRRRGIRT
jgi:hypothetical protein